MAPTDPPEGSPPGPPTGGGPDSRDAHDPRDAATASFRERVLRWVAAVPPGRVVTYGQVALLAGRPRAARQVGAVLRGLRPEETAPADAAGHGGAGGGVPWQRVVNASGGLSTYKIGGGHLQRALLEAEGVRFGADGTLDLRRYRWQPDDLPDDSPIPDLHPDDC